MNYSEIRRIARETLKGNWGVSVLCTLVIFIITGVVAVLGKVSSLLEIALPVFVSLPIGYGMYNAFKKLHFEKDDQVLSNVFKIAFANQKSYLKMVGAGFLSTVIVCLGYILLIIPGVILSLAYALVPFIVVDNPELPIDDVLTRSRKMMKGHKWDLFILCWTFIGWFLLSILTFGIGFLFLTPYVTVSIVEFYSRVKKEFKLKTAPEVINEDTVVAEVSEEDIEVL